MANWVRYPLPLFWAFPPLESMRSGGAIPPLKRGISAIPARYPMKTRQMGAIPPSAILSRKGIARYGGVSRIGPLSVGMKLEPFFASKLATFPLKCSVLGSLKRPEAATAFSSDLIHGCHKGLWKLFFRGLLVRKPPHVGGDRFSETGRIRFHLVCFCPGLC